MNNDTNKSVVLIIVAIIGSSATCIAAIIGLGHPIVERLVDIYISTSTPIPTTVVAKADTIVDDSDTTSIISRSPSEVLATSTTEPIIVTNTPLPTHTPLSPQPTYTPLPTHTPLSPQPTYTSLPSPTHPPSPTPTALTSVRTPSVIQSAATVPNSVSCISPTELANQKGWDIVDPMVDQYGGAVINLSQDNILPSLWEAIRYDQTKTIKQFDNDRIMISGKWVIFVPCECRSTFGFHSC